MQALMFVCTLQACLHSHIEEAHVHYEALRGKPFTLEGEGHTGQNANPSFILLPSVILLFTAMISAFHLPVIVSTTSSLCSSTCRQSKEQTAKMKLMALKVNAAKENRLS